MEGIGRGRQEGELGSTQSAALNYPLETVDKEQLWYVRKKGAGWCMCGGCGGKTDTGGQCLPESFSLAGIGLLHSEVYIIDALQKMIVTFKIQCMPSEEGKIV